MAFSAENYLKLLLNLLPKGRGIWTREEGGFWYNFCYAFAEELARIDSRVDDSKDELDTRKTNEMIDDWERDLGLPGNCFKDTIYNSRLAHRRNIAHAKYIVEGGLNRKSYIDFLKNMGFLIGIDTAGLSPYEIQVNTPTFQEDWVYFECGQTQCGNPLIWAENADVLNCIMQKYKPAHAKIVWNFYDLNPAFSCAFDQSFDAVPWLWETTLLEFEVINTQVIEGVFATAGTNNKIIVDWGDGTNDIYADTSDQAYSKDYGAIVNKTVKVYGYSETTLKKFTMTAVSANISFDIGTLPTGIEYVAIYGINTVYGSLNENLTELTDFIVNGYNFVTGDISSLSSSLINFEVRGYNTITGDIGYLPTNLESFIIDGYNTIFGDIRDQPANLGAVYWLGYNTISGSISNVSPAAQTVYITGQNTVSDYYSWNLSATVNIFYVNPISPGGLLSDEVDKFLIDADTYVTSWINGKTIYLKGNNAARTSASDAAVTSLQGKGVTIYTN
jgi:uncharacterized protein YmfQ (DUF2313 family)